MSFSTGKLVLKPAPPKIWTASDTTLLQWSEAKSFAMDAQVVLRIPLSAIQADCELEDERVCVPVAVFTHCQWQAGTGKCFITASDSLAPRLLKSGVCLCVCVRASARVCHCLPVHPGSASGSVCVVCN